MRRETFINQQAYCDVIQNVFQFVYVEGTQQTVCDRPTGRDLCPRGWIYPYPIVQRVLTGSRTVDWNRVDGNPHVVERRIELCDGYVRLVYSRSGIDPTDSQVDIALRLVAGGFQYLADLVIGQCRRACEAQARNAGGDGTSHGRPVPRLVASSHDGAHYLVSWRGNIDP